MVVTCIETLSNEIFYEIFEYLDGYKLYQSFSNLNNRFQDLLDHSLFILKFIDDTQSETQSKYCYTQFIIPNQHRTYSLQLNSSPLIELFFTLCNINSSFHRLEALVLNKIESQLLIKLLDRLTVLPCLFSLNIQLNDDHASLNDIYQLIFRLPFLKSNHLIIKKLNEQSIFLSNKKNEQFSPIEYLNIEHDCTVNELMSLLSYTPRIRRLTCEQLFSSSEYHESKLFIELPNLTHISIRMCNLLFDQFTRFIEKISSQLQVLRINTMKNLTYLHADEWERLIVDYIPQLSKLHFEYIGYLYEYCATRFNHPQMNGFTSSFWTERQWMFELKIDSQRIVQAIHPYKRTWFDFHEQKEISMYSNQPIVTMHSSLKWDQRLMYLANPIFSLIPITYLNIDCRQIHLQIFLKLLHYLPDLNVLRLSSVSSLLSGYLDAKRSGIIQTIADRNNITKISLNQMIYMGEIWLIIDLCLRMRYLEIACINEIDLISFLHFILNKQSNICIPDLRILCLHVRNLSDSRMEKLRKMITSEKLLIDYDIERLDHTINLYWKTQ
jgi:hypothetical protein